MTFVANDKSKKQFFYSLCLTFIAPLAFEFHANGNELDYPKLKVHLFNGKVP
jgi:hypothetical protein